MNLFAVPAILSAAYHLFALWAGSRKLRERTPASSFTPPISILKPVRGTDARFAEAIASHAVQHYPEYEILFGLSDPDDSARAEITLLAERYPALNIRLLIAPTDAPNGKVGVLEVLAAQARYPVLLVNDSDIVVDRDYLGLVVAPLADERVGLVTCLYRGTGGSFPTRSEALGIATEFAPSVLVARHVGVQEFAMGSTLVFRASELRKMGGFAAIRDYLADDYQLGKKLTSAGATVVLGYPVVATWLGAGTWRDVWKHQIRWSRTIRVSRTAGFFGYAITHTILWCLLGAWTGSTRLAMACYGVRMVSGLVIAGKVMHDRASLSLWWWMPARDLFSLATWAAALFGHQVEWRGLRLRIDRAGRVREISGAAAKPSREPDGFND